ncbi:MAG: KTSC domain-containing protein [Candidatus Sulfotelmatobacter sp.]
MGSFRSAFFHRRHAFMEKGHDPIPETISVSASDRTIDQSELDGALHPGMNDTAARSPHLILRRFIRIQESMQRVSVDSSSIASIGYAPEQQVLELEFRQSGEVYQYFDVPAEEHAAFLAADSKGTYLNLQFKPRQYRYHRVWPQEK